VRHPLRERSKSITLPNYQQGEKKNFPISRLNSFDPHLKKHRGSIVSMQSSLQSIEEGDDVEHEEHSSQIIKQQDAIGSLSKTVVERSLANFIEQTFKSCEVAYLGKLNFEFWAWTQE
jgi:hypothetical protein